MSSPAGRRPAPRGATNGRETLRAAAPLRPWRCRLAAALLALATLAALGPGARPAAGASPPAAHGSGGAVASDEPVATAAGLDILAAGGNAVDAAVATALALAVVHPQAGNLGGGGFAVVAIGGELAALDFRETAPAAATAAMFLDATGAPRPDASLLGGLAVAVPGSPAGYHELHRRFGHLPWAAVVAPAERLARSGFVLSRREAGVLAEETTKLARFPETAATWLVDGKPPVAGDRIRLPALADTLADYARHGPTALTTGARARAIAAASQRHGGVLTTEDLAAYRPVWRPPLRFERLGWQIATMPLPASGGTIVGQALDLLARTRWGEAPRGGAVRAHLLAEVLRAVFVDRRLLGDPGSARATPEQILAPDWLARRAAAIDPDRARPAVELVPGPGAARREPTETTQVSTVDGAGNLVALTTTLNAAYGSRVYVSEIGYFLNDEMDDFATAPGRPNLFGLVQSETNAVAPGRRMLSSMSPLVARRGEEGLAIGGRGGSRIPTATLQVLLALWIDGDPLQAAVDRPRLHQQDLPDALEAETDALAPETAAELARRGHRVAVASKTAKVNVVRRLADGTYEAAADSRGPGGAGVVHPQP